MRTWLIVPTRCRRSRPVSAGAVLVLSALLVLCVGCTDRSGGERPAGDEPLLVLAASDLQAVMPELIARYEAVTGRRAEAMLGSTGNLTSQIEHGAPGDVFLAADESFIDRLAGRGLIVPETRRVYAIGPLALVSASGTRKPSSVAELVHAAYGTIAIANPEHAPYGMAAREAMAAAGVWDELRPRLVLAENVAQALQYVRTGNVDAGIVALGLVVPLAGFEYRVVDPALHPPLRQTGAVLRGSARPDEAESFLELVTGEKGRAVLRRYGFDLPEPG